ncbi:MAG: glycosyltransferase family 2 protein [Acidimicrobiales bacterium]
MSPVSTPLDRPGSPPAGSAGGMQRSVDVPFPVMVAHRRRRYVRVGHKFALSVAFAVAWLAFSVWISLSWIDDLARVISWVPAVVVVGLLAFVPGTLIAFLVAGLVLDRQPDLKVTSPTQPITVLIAARNEAAGIAETLRFLAEQDYAGPLAVILSDNGSTDSTVAVAVAAARSLGLTLGVAIEPIAGKSRALNRALASVNTALVVTVDADTLVHRSALRLLVARIESSPDDVDAVAGSVLVQNSRHSFWARLQEWDYFLGIASVKRMQGLFQSTLVAQGAFSLYRADAVRAAGGWPHAIGEDIVLTWKMMRNGARVYYEPLAVAFTTVPESFIGFGRQRARWARGMLEGLRAVPPWRQQHGLARVLTGIDVAIPLLDTAYVFLWIPGVVLACFGILWIAGPMTVAVIPVTLAVYAVLFRHQRRRVFEPLGLTVRRNLIGLFLFVVVYQTFMSAFSVIGYTQQLTRRSRRWK